MVFKYSNTNQSHLGWDECFRMEKRHYWQLMVLTNAWSMEAKTENLGERLVNFDITGNTNKIQRYLRALIPRAEVTKMMTSLSINNLAIRLNN